MDLLTNFRSENQRYDGRATAHFDDSILNQLFVTRMSDESLWVMVWLGMYDFLGKYSIIKPLLFFELMDGFSEGLKKDF